MISQSGMAAPSDRSERYRRFRWVYGRAHYGRTLLWHSSEILFAFFINQRAGLSPLSTGIILCAGLASSAMIDIIMARVLRTKPLTLQRAQRLQLAGAIASTIGIVAFFAADLMPLSFRFSYTIAAAIVFRIAYSLGDIPHNAILALATADFRSRRELAMIRLFFSGLASITIATILTLIIGTTMIGHIGIFLVAALFVSVVAIVTATCLSLYPVHAFEPEQAAADPAAIPSARGISPTTARLLVMMTLLCSAIAAFTILEPFYVASRYGDTAKQTIIIASSLGLALAQPVWARLGRHWTPRSIMGATIVALILSLVGFGLVEHAGRGGQPLLSFLFGVANGGIGMAMWSAYAEEVARRKGARDPMAFALLTCFAKLGSAFATILIALSLFAGSGMVSPLAMTWCPAALATIVLLIHLRWGGGDACGPGKTAKVA